MKRFGLMRVEVLPLNEAQMCRPSPRRCWHAANTSIVNLK